MPSTEAWVGTWRPHKPRGPIAALYGSPGPKYALPGLTGIHFHDPTKFKAPMFSFGTRHAAASLNNSPGPCYLIRSNTTRTGRDGTPAFSLHSRPKGLKLFPVPGPGHYSPETSGKSVFPSSPSYSLTGRGKVGINCHAPGPASYTLPSMLGPNSVVTTRAPGYSLYGRQRHGSFIEDTKKTPGPAAYSVVDPCTYKQKSPQFSMTGRNFTPGESSTAKKPGPGAHSPERVTSTRAKAPSFSFGLRHSEYMAPLIIDESK